MEIKTREEYNFIWSYLGWLCMKPEFGGPTWGTSEDRKMIWDAINKYDAKYKEN